MRNGLPTPEGVGSVLVRFRSDAHANGPGHRPGHSLARGRPVRRAHPQGLACPHAPGARRRRHRLWPGYWPAERLAAKRLEMGSAMFDLQYQNDPSGMGGNIFRREWFRSVEEVPAGARRVGVDLAASTKERSDYTAAVEIVEDAEHNLYLCGAWRERLEDGHRQ